MIPVFPTIHMKVFFGQDQFQELSLDNKRFKKMRSQSYPIDII